LGAKAMDIDQTGIKKQMVGFEFEGLNWSGGYPQSVKNC